jgi:hypothetical protein
MKRNFKIPEVGIIVSVRILKKYIRVQLLDGTTKVIIQGIICELDNYHEKVEEYVTGWADSTHALLVNTWIEHSLEVKKKIWQKRTICLNVKRKKKLKKALP